MSRYRATERELLEQVRMYEGKMKDIEDGLDSMDEILEEVGETQLKKAGGGLAYMLGE